VSWLTLVYWNIDIYSSGSSYRQRLVSVPVTVLFALAIRQRILRLFGLREIGFDPDFSSAFDFVRECSSIFDAKQQDISKRDAPEL